MKGNNRYDKHDKRKQQEKAELLQRHRVVMISETLEENLEATKPVRYNGSLLKDSSMDETCAKQISSKSSVDAHLEDTVSRDLEIAQQLKSMDIIISVNERPRIASRVKFMSIQGIGRRLKVFDVLSSTFPGVKITSRKLELDKKIEIKSIHRIECMHVDIRREDAPRVEPKSLSTMVLDNVVMKLLKVLNSLTSVNEVRNEAIGNAQREVSKAVQQYVATSIESLKVKAEEQRLVTKLELLDVLISFVSRLVDGRPKIVIVPEIEKHPEESPLTYTDLVVVILKYVYRVLRGSRPNARYIVDSDEARELYPQIKASSNIVVLKADLLKEGSAVRKFIIDRLRELISQDLGYIVLSVPVKVSGSKCLDIRLKDVVSLLNSVFGGHVWGNPDIVMFYDVHRLCENTEEFINEMRRLAARLYGFEDLELEVDEIPNQIVRASEARYYQSLSELLKDTKIAMKMKFSPQYEYGEVAENPNILESEDHLLLKALTVKELIGKGFDVKVEEEIQPKISGKNQSQIVVDVYAMKGSEEVCVEVETLYGQRIPEVKIYHVLQTREGRCKKLWIVLPRPIWELFGRRVKDTIREYIEAKTAEGYVAYEEIAVKTVKIERDESKLLRPKLIDAIVYRP